MLNAISGVRTQFSCEGIRRGVVLDRWPHGPIWFPARHQPLAHVQFAAIPADLEAELDTWLQSRGVGDCQVGPAEADMPEHKAEFVEALEEFALAKQPAEGRSQASQ